MNESIYDENGNLRMPCKPGDFVYLLDRSNKKIVTKKVKNINCYISAEHFSMQIEFETTGFAFHREFEKSLFLKKSAAQKALNEYLERLAT